MSLSELNIHLALKVKIQGWEILFETLKFIFTSSFYPPYHLGGDANHVRYLAEELVNRGHEVHVLHSLDAYKVKRKGTPVPSDSHGVITHPIETRFSRSAYEAYLFGNSRPVNEKFRDLVREVAPDVVHHHNISLLGYNILQKIGDYPNFYSAHDYWLVCPRSNLLKNGKEICTKPSCTKCGLYYRKPPQLWRRQGSFEEAIGGLDILIASSNYAKEMFAERLAVKQVVIPNFVPIPPHQIESSGFSNFFLFVGMLERHKGAPQLIEAFKAIKKRKDAKLIIVGSGSLESAIGRQIQESGLQDRILLFKWMELDSIYRLLKDSTALVIPSIWPENCPLIALQAFSVGTPVIGSKTGGLQEVVEKLNPHLLYESNAELVEILDSFGSCPPDSVKQVYEKYYSPRVFMNKYFELVNSFTSV
jgi:glycosyltransferase involved in cell wall biosynthesis